MLCAVFYMILAPACQSGRVSYTPHHILPPAGGGKTFMVFPVRKERIGQLASTNYGVRVAQQLERHGYRLHRTPAVGREAFDFIVFYDYGSIEEGTVKTSPSKLYESSFLKETPNVEAPYSFFDILIIERSRKIPPSGIVYENRIIFEGKMDGINNELIDAALRSFPGESGRTYRSQLRNLR
jgi:hypothetical protein